MNLFESFRRWLTSLPLPESIEDTHVRLINDWITEPDCSVIHPNCVWRVANGHPYDGVYEGVDFLEQYGQHITTIYPEWFDLTHEIIGSPIGAIVVGDYYFKHESVGLRYKAPFTHFYRICRGQIVSVRYYMGETSIQLAQSWPISQRMALFDVHYLN